MTEEWPPGAVEYVLSITDTKLVLSHRYSSRMFSGETMEDRSADASAAQEELGHVRQLFTLLEDQGRDQDWLQGDRDRIEYHNAASLDESGDRWLGSVVRTGLTDRAAWLLLDAIDHPEFEGMVQKIGEEEYFHLEYQDARIEAWAADDPAAVQQTIRTVLEDVLAFIGPPTYTADDDPLYAAGFTAIPAADLREQFLRHYEALFADTDVSLTDIPCDGLAIDEWNEARRRKNGGGIGRDVARSLQWSRNEAVTES